MLTRISAEITILNEDAAWSPEELTEAFIQAMDAAREKYGVGMVKLYLGTHIVSYGDVDERNNLPMTPHTALKIWGEKQELVDAVGSLYIKKAVEDLKVPLDRIKCLVRDLDSGPGGEG